MPLVVVVVLVGATLTLTVTGAETLTLALALLVVSAALVAFTEYVPAVLGAVYSPVEEIVPAVADQVTAVLVEPLTVALNCAVPLVVVVVLFGEIPTLIVEPLAAVMVTVAVAVLLGSATLVAITVAVSAEAGAVYTPLLDTVPPPLATLQLTAVLLAPPTVAVNCTVPLAVSVVLVGAMLTLTVAAAPPVFGVVAEPAPAAPPQPE